MESVKVQQINDAIKARMNAFMAEWSDRLGQMPDDVWEAHVEELRQASRDAEAARQEERAAKAVP